MYGVASFWSHFKLIAPVWDRAVSFFVHEGGWMYLNRIYPWWRVFPSIGAHNCELLKGHIPYPYFTAGTSQSPLFQYVIIQVLGIPVLFQNLFSSGGFYVWKYIAISFPCYFVPEYLAGSSTPGLVAWPYVQLKEVVWWVSHGSE